jgi:RNA-directed DNA polymerase
MDAMEAIHLTTMNRQNCSPWVLDADSGGFDNIDHATVVAKLPVFTTTLRQWLKQESSKLASARLRTLARHKEEWFPLLANVALDGMERLFAAEYTDGRPKRPGLRKGLNKGLAVIRYADDCVITAPTRDVVATYARPRGEQFLQERGLARSEAKTRIVHITEGLHFLGCHLRQCGPPGKWLTVPQKDKVLTHVRAIRSYLEAPKPPPAGRVITALHPLIRGWAHSSRHCAAKHVLQKVRHAPWQRLWRWAKRRHPTKGRRGVQARDFRDDGSWTFSEGKAEVVKPDAPPSTRVTKVTGQHSPYDPTLRQDWMERRKQHVGRATSKQQRLRRHQRQGYRCVLCNPPFIAGETRETDHMLPRSQGGTDDLSNKRLGHPWCHRQRHQTARRQWPRA